MDEKVCEDVEKADDVKKYGGLKLRNVRYLNQFDLADYIGKKFDLQIEKYNMKI